MRKFTAILLSILLCVSLVACDEKKDDKSHNNTSGNKKQNSQSGTENKGEKDNPEENVGAEEAYSITYQEVQEFNKLCLYNYGMLWRKNDRFEENMYFYGKYTNLSLTNSEYLKPAGVDPEKIVQLVLPFACLMDDGTVSSYDGTLYYNTPNPIIKVVNKNSSCILGLTENGLVAEIDVYKDMPRMLEYENVKDIIPIGSGAVILKEDGTFELEEYSRINQNVVKLDEIDWNEVVSAGYTGGECQFLAASLKDGTVKVTGVNYPEEAEKWTDIVWISVLNDSIVGLKSDGTLVFAINEYVKQNGTEEEKEKLKKLEETKEQCKNWGKLCGFETSGLLDGLVMGIGADGVFYTNIEGPLYHTALVYEDGEYKQKTEYMSGDDFTGAKAYKSYYVGHEIK